MLGGEKRPDPEVPGQSAAFPLSSLGTPCLPGTGLPSLGLTLPSLLGPFHVFGNEGLPVCQWSQGLPSAVTVLGHPQRQNVGLFSEKKRGLVLAAAQSFSIGDGGSGFPSPVSPVYCQGSSSVCCLSILSPWGEGLEGGDAAFLWPNGAQSTPTPFGASCSQVVRNRHFENLSVHHHHPPYPRFPVRATWPLHFELRPCPLGFAKCGRATGIPQPRRSGGSV